MTRILLAGPDGVGKSTIADHLGRELSEFGFIIERLHYRPNILFRQSPTQTPSHHSPPISAVPHNYIRSLIKLLATYADTLTFEFITRVRRRESRNSKYVFIQERGWLDQSVDQTRYRLDPRVKPVVNVLARLIPRATFGVALVAPAMDVHARKQELSLAEITQQTEHWRRTIQFASRRSIEVDATRPPEEIARSIALWMQA
jgi:DNA polymerase III delta prime subunit